MFSGGRWANRRVSSRSERCQNLREPQANLNQLSQSSRSWHGPCYTAGFLHHAPQRFLEHFMGKLDFLRTRLGFVKPLLEAIVSLETRIAEWWVSGAYHRLFLVQWGIYPLPEFFEHKIGMFGRWTRTREAYWVERGVFSLLTMAQGSKVLELCCGDGFNAHHFYSCRAGSVLAVDFDAKAINYARRNFKAPNVRYEIADIRTAMPNGSFDNIVWDAAIEHFTEQEISDLLAAIKKRLAPGGAVSGYTFVEASTGKQRFVHHEIEFNSTEDLARFFYPHFKNVKVFQTIYSERTNLYFWASDKDLPFSPTWPHATSN
jgi:SAM-dependent methyltransferase